MIAWPYLPASQPWRELVLREGFSDCRGTGWPARDERRVCYLQRRDVRRLQALRALLGFEADLLVLSERLETFRADFREMREKVVAAVVGRDEAEALAVVEPLDDTGIHEIP